jgi:hypothetical protein
MRRPALIRCEALIVPGRRIALLVRDLSDAGFCGETDDFVPIGGWVIVYAWGLGPAAAQVRWALGGLFGACWRRPGEPQSS